jgi:D-alanine-D-alanine ligase-like ATP-grasp enzyme
MQEVLEKNSTKKRIGILRGGPDEHYHYSLQKGGEVILYLHENLSDKYKVLDILVDKDYIWHINGLPIAPSNLKDKVDMVWNLSHINFSNILDSFNIPHLNVSPFSGHLLESRTKLQERMQNLGVNMPRYMILPVYLEDIDKDIETYANKKAKEIFEKFGSPWIVKSFNHDPSMGIHLAKTFPELVNALIDGAEHKDSILVEEFITGKNIVAHSVPYFRNQDLYIFPHSNLIQKEKDALNNIINIVHNGLVAGHYLESHFIIHPKKGIYLLAVNSVPNLKEDSHFKKSTESVGAKIHHVIEHIIDKILK